MTDEPTPQVGEHGSATADMIPTVYHGERCRVVACQGLLESIEEALTSVPAGRRASLTRTIRLQIERLGAGVPISRENFPEEGSLPSYRGKPAKKFRALKKQPLRIYCWMSSRLPGTWFLSHGVYKDQTKLDPRDTQRVCRNWKRIEENDEDS